MLTHPTAQALVEGVARWLPVDGSASGFTLRVARNALEIAARDMAMGPGADARAADRMRALLGMERAIATRWTRRWSPRSGKAGSRPTIPRWSRIWPPARSTPWRSTSRATRMNWDSANRAFIKRR